ncbi:MAG: hypothetical protein PHW11_10305 [Anaerolineaceae bacterium]|nr:hypothetical protein [Anaerolineaceae bacterium]MDD4043381.1 hypothetical protein [Anaerolineaceae bacterium]MDD4578471.1 hypothetical protein [Anaerolineaceae bacterium]
MTNKEACESPSFYQIQVRGIFDESWSDWLDGFRVTQQGDQTLLEGQTMDQAALLGVLSKINDLGLAILSVIRREQ